MKNWMDSNTIMESKMIVWWTNAFEDYERLQNNGANLAHLPVDNVLESSGLRRNAFSLGLNTQGCLLWST